MKNNELNVSQITFPQKFRVSTGSGQRAIADTIENAIVEDYVNNHNGVKPKSVRTIEDYSIDNKLVDIKTRDIDRDFSMPNLISVDRLMKNKDKHIEYQFVEYQVKDGYAQITHVENRPIHTICWSAMKIQNLGLGQLQLVKTSDIPYYTGSKDEWYKELRVQMNAFYEKQIKKFERLICYENNDIMG